MTERAVIASYVVGFFVTWFIAARWWGRHFGTKGFDAVEGGAWAAFVAGAWPFFAVAWCAMKVAEHAS